MKIRFNKQFFKVAFLAIIISSTAFYNGNQASAQSDVQKGSAVGISVSPPTFELTANPGDTMNEVIRVTSLSDSIVTYEMQTEDFRVEGLEGVVALKEDPNPKAFSKWFTFEPASFQLKPKETKNIRFTIKVPKDAEPGGHFASAIFRPKSVQTENSTGAQVIQRVATLVLLNVSGDIQEKGEVGQFGAKTFVGEWESITQADGKTIINLARKEDLKSETAAGYFKEGPIAFDLTLKNDGNVHYKPNGTVTIYNIFGQEVDKLTIDPRNVFPGGERRITVVWPETNLWGIRYTAKVTALYGSTNQTLSSETSFWAFPWEAAVALVIFLIIIFLLRRRIVEAIKVIAKGK